MKLKVWHKVLIFFSIVIGVLIILSQDLNLSSFETGKLIGKAIPILIAIVIIFFQVEKFNKKKNEKK